MSAIIYQRFSNSRMLFRQHTLAPVDAACVLEDRGREEATRARDPERTRSVRVVLGGALREQHMHAGAIGLSRTFFPRISGCLDDGGRRQTAWPRSVDNHSRCEPDVRRWQRMQLGCEQAMRSCRMSPQGGAMATKYGQYAVDELVQGSVLVVEGLCA